MIQRPLGEHHNADIGTLVCSLLDHNLDTPLGFLILPQRPPYPYNNEH